MIISHFLWVRYLDTVYLGPVSGSLTGCTEVVLGLQSSQSMNWGRMNFQVHVVVGIPKFLAGCCPEANLGS